jgi:predicted O-methyltransferase YrrM
LVLGRLRGKGFNEVMSPSILKEVYIPISPEQGEFLYLTARAIAAKRIVEFGTSFGISAIYLAAAVKDNGGGLVIGTEIEPSKHQRAVANLKEAGLEKVVEVRFGDALETLQDLTEPIDMVLLDGVKELYLPVLKIIKPRLRQGAVVIADNIFMFKKSLRPYVEYVQSGKNGFQSTTLRIADGFEYSIYTATRRKA